MAQDGTTVEQAKYLPQDDPTAALTALAAFAMVGIAPLFALGTTVAPAGFVVNGVRYAVATQELAEAWAAVDLALATNTAIPAAATDVLTLASASAFGAGGNGVLSISAIVALNAYDTSANAWDTARMNAYLRNYFGGGGPGGGGGPAGTWPHGYPLYPGGGGPTPGTTPVNPGPGGVGGPPTSNPPPPAGSPPPPPPPGVGGDAEASACFVPGDIEFCHKLD